MKNLIKKIIMCFCVAMLIVTMIVPATSANADYVSGLQFVNIINNKKTVYMENTFTVKTNVKVSNIKFSSSNKKIAKIDSKGKIIPKKIGKCTIYARDKSSNQLISFQLKVGKATKLKITNANKSKTMISGNTFTLKTNKDNLKFKSSKKSVIRVNSSGVITAIKNGSATITVTDKDTKQNATINILVKTKVSNVDITTSSFSIVKGKTKTLKVCISPKNASDKSVIWKSSNNSIASVNKKGKVTAKKAGVCTISAISKDGTKKSDSIKIKVTNSSVGNFEAYPNILYLEPDESFKIVTNVNNSNLTWDLGRSEEYLNITSDGIVTAKKISDKYPYEVVKVKSDTKLQEIQVKIIEMKYFNVLKVGQIKQINYDIKSNTTFEIGDTSIATITPTGKITAIKDGETYVKIITGDIVEYRPIISIDGTWKEVQWMKQFYSSLEEYVPNLHLDFISNYLKYNGMSNSEIENLVKINGLSFNGYLKETTTRNMDYTDTTQKYPSQYTMAIEAWRITNVYGSKAIYVKYCGHYGTNIKFQVYAEK